MIWKPWNKFILLLLKFVRISFIDVSIHWRFYALCFWGLVLVEPWTILVFLLRRFLHVLAEKPSFSVFLLIQNFEKEFSSEGTNFDPTGGFINFINNEQSWLKNANSAHAKVKIRKLQKIQKDPSFGHVHSPRVGFRGYFFDSLWKLGGAPYFGPGKIIVFSFNVSFFIHYILFLFILLLFYLLFVLCCSFHVLFIVYHYAEQLPQVPQNLLKCFSSIQPSFLSGRTHLKSHPGVGRGRGRHLAIGLATESRVAI